MFSAIFLPSLRPFVPPSGTVNAHSYTLYFISYLASTASSSFKVSFTTIHEFLAKSHKKSPHPFGGIATKQQGES